MTRFTNGTLMAVLMFPQMLFWNSAERTLRLHFCPPATFMSGTLQPGLEIFEIFAALSLAMFIRYWVLVLVPSLRRSFGFGNLSEGPWRHVGSHIWLTAFLVSVAAFVGAEMSPFCLASDQITIRDTPWAKVQRYDWNEVAGVQSGCSKAPKNGFNLYYDLIMVDGKSVNLAASVPDFEPGYQPMLQALATIGHHPPLNSQNVRMDCGYRNVQLLTQPL